MGRTVQLAREPAQPSQPARVRPVATRSNDFVGRMQVLSYLTQPHAGRLLVFRFKTCDTWPKPSFILSSEFLRISDQLRRDPSRFGPDTSRSGPDPWRSGKISLLSDEIRSLSRWIRSLPRQIWSLSRWIRSLSRRIQPDFVPSDKPDIDPTRLETDETRTEKSDQISGSVSGHIFLHPNNSGRFRVGHKFDPTCGHP